jgi:xanthine dehydrogenase molybdopterin-binding subunit B
VNPSKLGIFKVSPIKNLIRKDLKYCLTATIKKHQGKGLKTIVGEFESGAQYHFYMESQSVIARPSEKGQIDIYSATQWMENAQMMVAQALGKPAHLINLEVRRLGGAYGGKTWYSGHVAAAAAVAVNKLKKPIRLVMDIRSVFETLGKRHPFLGKYTAGVDSNDKLLFVNMTVYSDSGFSFFADMSGAATAFAKVLSHSDQSDCNLIHIVFRIAMLQLLGS